MGLPRSLVKLIQAKLVFQPLMLVLVSIVLNTSLSLNKWVLLSHSKVFLVFAQVTVQLLDMVLMLQWVHCILMHSSNKEQLLQMFFHLLLKASKPASNPYWILVILTSLKFNQVNPLSIFN